MRGRGPRLLERERQNESDAEIARLEHPLLDGSNRCRIEIRELRASHSGGSYFTVRSDVYAKSDRSCGVFHPQRLGIIRVDGIDNLHGSPRLDRVINAT